MKTLEEIKDRISEESLYRDWVAFINDQPNWKVEEIMDEVAKRYALEAVKADRERVAEEAEIERDYNCGHYEPCDCARVNKQSILNLPIELK